MAEAKEFDAVCLLVLLFFGLVCFWARALGNVLDELRKGSKSNE